MGQMNTLHAHKLLQLVPRHSAWLFHHNSSSLPLISSALHSASPHPRPGDMSPSRERVSPEEASTCQKKFTSSPPCLPSPSNSSVSHVSCAPFLAPITPQLPSFSCYLIQITELASVSFVRSPILPGGRIDRKDRRWTPLDRSFVHVCL